ncbi:MAG: DUF3243 domain-containing protein [Firmicutes bacterium]|nr:DUF3243 domain-containing protein [Bacillota bacterium]
MQIMESFDAFRKFLSSQLDLVEKIGVPDEVIERATERIADYLADNVAPRTPEQRLLRELWRLGSEEDQKVLATLLVRLVAATKREKTETQ